jgi:hypothetical protein
MRCSYPLGDISQDSTGLPGATGLEPLLVSILAGEVLNELDAHLGGFVDAGVRFASPHTPARKDRVPGAPSPGLFSTPPYGRNCGGL